jgi:hypothetical protein
MVLGRRAIRSLFVVRRINTDERPSLPDCQSGSQPFNDDKTLLCIYLVDST